MSHERVTPERLDSWLALPAEDPRRQELEACPRCRVLLASYAEFLDGPKDRDPELLKFLNAPARKAVRPWRRWQRPLAAAAAVLIVAVGLSRWDFGEPPRPSIQRGGEASPSFAAEAVAEEDSLLFSWEPVAEADHYVLVIFNEDLSERMRFPAEAAMELTVEMAEIGQPGQAFAWRVLALADSDEIESSALSFMQLP